MSQITFEAPFSSPLGGPTDLVGWVLKAQDVSPFAFHPY